MFKSYILVLIAGLFVAPAFAKSGENGGGYPPPKCYTRDSLRIVWYGDTAEEAVGDCLNFGHKEGPYKNCKTVTCDTGFGLADGNK